MPNSRFGLNLTLMARKLISSRKELQPLWLVLSILIWTICTLIYSFWLGPVVESSPWGSQATFLPTGFWIPTFVVPVGFGLGLLVTLLVLERPNPIVLFRATRARMIGAVLFFLLFPKGTVNGFPALFFGWSGASPDLRDTLTLALIPICYAISCILSSGFAARDGKFFAYLLMWISALFATIALGFAQPFRI